MENIDKNSLHNLFLEILRLHHLRTHTLLDEVGIYPGSTTFIIHFE